MKVIYSIDSEKCICECAIQENGRKKNEKEKNRRDFSASSFFLLFFLLPLSFSFIRSSFSSIEKRNKEGKKMLVFFQKILQGNIILKP